MKEMINKKQGKLTKKWNDPEELKLSIKVDAILCTEHMWMAHAAYADAAVRLRRIAQDDKHLAELLDVLDHEIVRIRLPLNQRGTGLLKRLGRGPLPDVE